MPDVDGIIQLFSAVNIGHKEWKGSQTAHAVPFPKTKTRMVHEASYQLGVCDRPGEPGTGSPLFYINSWAMIWPVDYQS